MTSRVATKRALITHGRRAAALLLGLLVVETSGQAQSPQGDRKGQPASTHASQARVVDVGGVLLPEEISPLREVLAVLQQTHHMDWRVVAVRPDSSVDSLALQRFADSLRLTWQVGAHTEDRGGVIVLSIQDMEFGRRRRVALSVTTALAPQMLLWWKSPDGASRVQEMMRRGKTPEAFSAILTHVASITPPPVATEWFVVLALCGVIAGVTLVWVLKPAPTHS